MKRGRPPGRKLTHSLTLRIDDEVMNALVRMAEGDRRSVASMARIILEDGMGGKLEKRPEPREGGKE